VLAEALTTYRGGMTTHGFTVPEADARRRGCVRGDADVAAAAALIAEPARASLLLAVIEEGTLAASELAARARIAPSTASEHLARLLDGGFLTVRRRGRHRYYELANSAVAEAVEALARVAQQPPVRSLREATRSELIRQARTCYDHLAGRLGVALARALERRRVVALDHGTYVPGPKAEAGLAALGIDLDALAGQRRPLVRGCLDWSERELHIAGALGAALAERLFELGWIVRHDGSRSVAITAEGEDRLRRVLGISVP
jgi:DNA-binding transcriptional ArsR family regulator